jgi:hypothetical protein
MNLAGKGIDGIQTVAGNANKITNICSTDPESCPEGT